LVRGLNENEEHVSLRGFLNLTKYSQEGIKGIDNALKQHVIWTVNIGDSLS